MKKPVSDGGGIKNLDIEKLGKEPVGFSRSVAESTATSSRMGNEVTVVSRVLYEHKDIFGRVLSEFKMNELKNLRLVCLESAKQVLDVWVKNGCFVKIYPIDLTNNKRFNSLLCIGESEKCNKINENKFKFISENQFRFKLMLCNKLDLQAFSTLLCSDQMKEDDLIQRIRRIASFAMAGVDIEEEKIFKEILEKVNQFNNAFISLKSLMTTEIVDLTDFTIPNSIEHFESCINGNPNPKKILIFGYDSVNICNLANLKSITINFSISSFKIEKLPNLQSIRLNSRPSFDTTINCKEYPNLTSVIVCDEEMFDKSCEILIIRGVNNSSFVCGPIFGRLLGELQLPPNLIASKLD